MSVDSWSIYVPLVVNRRSSHTYCLCRLNFLVFLCRHFVCMRTSWKTVPVLSNQHLLVQIRKPPWLGKLPPWLLLDQIPSFFFSVTLSLILVYFLVEESTAGVVVLCNLPLLCKGSFHESLADLSWVEIILWLWGDHSQKILTWEVKHLAGSAITDHFALIQFLQ